VIATVLGRFVQVGLSRGMHRGDEARGADAKSHGKHKQQSLHVILQ
jgi:hypothetical protein